MVPNLGGALPAAAAGGRDSENPNANNGPESSLAFFAGTIKHDE